MAVPVYQLTVPFTETPAYYSGVGSTTLVPSVYPVAINGRPYMVDQKSGKFQRGYEQRVRDSVDQSTAPGESAINPGGLWRRGQDSWHYGSGQRYADTAESQDYRFYKSKGVNPWVKGQLSLLNSTSIASGTNAPTTGTGKMLVNGSNIFVISGTNTLKYASTPSGTWTTITAPTSTTAILALATDGTNLYGAFTGTASSHDGVYKTSVSTPTTWTRQVHDPVTEMAYVNGRLICSYNNILYDASEKLYGTAGNLGGSEILMTHRDSNFRWKGFAAGSGYIYAAGNVDGVSLVYKITILPDATALGAPSVALQLPFGEAITCIDAYLGYVFIGTNSGVRMATSDGAGNLMVGSLIPTTSAVNDFTGDGRFVWFTWSAYDDASGGLGRLDVSTSIGTNTPAFASDLMYETTGVVRSVVNFNSTRIFTIDNVGVAYENTASLVSEGTIETGTYRWGIPDRKFVAKVDVRAEPLNGSVTAYLSNDQSAYASLGTWPYSGQTEYTYAGSDNKTIEASMKFLLTRGTTVTTGPVVTRWMARAYAAPYRSQFFVVPVLLHSKLKIRNREYHIEVQDELDVLDKLISNPSIVILQIGTSSHSVIVEDVEWTPLDSYGTTWEWEGTATITMRSVEN